MSPPKWSARLACLALLTSVLLSTACISSKGDQTTPTRAASATEAPRGGKPTPPPTPTALTSAPCSLPNQGCAFARDVAAGLKTGDSASAAATMAAAGTMGTDIACPADNFIALSPVCDGKVGQVVRGVFVLAAKGPAVTVPPAAVADALSVILKRSPTPAVSGTYTLRGTACPAAGAGRGDCSQFFMFAIDAPTQAPEPRTIDFMFRRDASGANLVAVFNVEVNAYPEVAGGPWQFDFPPLQVPKDWWFQPVQ